MGFSCTASFRWSPSHLHPQSLHAPSLIPLQLRQSPRLSRSSVSHNATGLRTTRRGVIGIQGQFDMRARKFKVRACRDEISLRSSSGTRLVAVSSALTVILAVANRVLYKLALVPMKQYPFFLAQLTTFGCVLVILLSTPPPPHPTPHPRSLIPFDIIRFSA